MNADTPSKFAAAMSAGEPLANVVIQCGPIIKPQAKLTKEQKKIPAISKIHEFEFVEEGVVMRRVSQLGPGKKVKLPVITITTRYKANIVNENNLRNFKPIKQTMAHAPGKEIPIEINSVEGDKEQGTQYPCTNEGCSAIFDSIPDMHNHLTGGVCLVEIHLSMYQYVRKGNIY